MGDHQYQNSFKLQGIFQRGITAFEIDSGRPLHPQKASGIPDEGSIVV